jgi:hypothetical protein
MNGSDPIPEVSLEDLAAFATGEADEATRERVKSAMSDIRHPLSYLIRTKEEVRRQLNAKATEERGGSEPESDPTVIDEIVHESYENEIQSYLKWEQSRIDDELSEFLPQQEAELVRKSGGKSSPLKPYLDEIRRVVCEEWGWCDRRDDGALNEPVNLVIALADSFVVYGAQIPFPPTLLAVALVNVGLDRLCRDRNSS